MTFLARGQNIITRLIGNGPNRRMTCPRKRDLDVNPQPELDPLRFETCIKSEGWTPAVHKRGLYFGQVKTWLTWKMARECNLDSLPGSLKHDCQKCMREQGRCL